MSIDVLKIAVDLQITVNQWPACVSVHFPCTGLPLSLIGHEGYTEDVSSGQDRYQTTVNLILKAADELEKQRKLK